MVDKNEECKILKELLLQALSSLQSGSISEALREDTISRIESGIDYINNLDAVPLQPPDFLQVQYDLRELAAGHFPTKEIKNPYTFDFGFVPVTLTNNLAPAEFTRGKALEIAARIWCDQDMSSIEMDTNLAVHISNLLYDRFSAGKK